MQNNNIVSFRVAEGTEKVQNENGKSEKIGFESIAIYPLFLGKALPETNPSQKIEYFHGYVEVLNATPSMTEAITMLLQAALKNEMLVCCKLKYLRRQHQFIKNYVEKCVCKIETFMATITRIENAQFQNSDQQCFQVINYLLIT